MGVWALIHVWGLLQPQPRPGQPSKQAVEFVTLLPETSVSLFQGLSSLSFSDCLQFFLSWLFWALSFLSASPLLSFLCLIFIWPFHPVLFWLSLTFQLSSDSGFTGDMGFYFCEYAWENHTHIYIYIYIYILQAPSLRILGASVTVSGANPCQAQCIKFPTLHPNSMCDCVLLIYSWPQGIWDWLVLGHHPPHHGSALSPIKRSSKIQMMFCLIHSCLNFDPNTYYLWSPLSSSSHPASFRTQVYY